MAAEKKAKLSWKEALRAAEQVSRQQRSTKTATSSTWKKGGKEWDRILGHFGSTQKRGAV